MIFRDSLGAPFRPIGTIWVPSSMATRTFETASWYEHIAHAGQTVILYSNGYWVKWTVTGYVVDSYFGGGKLTAPGTVRNHTFQSYAFQWAKDRMEGKYTDKEFVIDMLPEYGCGCAPYQHNPLQMGYFITMPDSGHPLQLVRQHGGAFTEHTYKVTWRGEAQPDVIVAYRDGFNGDTRNVAYQRASEALNLIEQSNV
jgi:hypothetical protein